MREYWDVLERPLVSEKSMMLSDAGRYVFRCKLEANKIEIRKAVETLYKVKVVDISTMRVRGKVRRVGRWVGKTVAWKKAIVTLAPGQRIDILEGV
jgi:large subunit ribosomal protein L23